MGIAGRAVGSRGRTMPDLSHLKPLKSKGRVHVDCWHGHCDCLRSSLHCNGFVEFCTGLYWLCTSSGIWFHGEAMWPLNSFHSRCADALLFCRMRSSVWRPSSDWVMPMLAAAERSAKEWRSFDEVLIGFGTIGRPVCYSCRLWLRWMSHLVSDSIYIRIQCV